VLLPALTSIIKQSTTIPPPTGKPSLDQLLPKIAVVDLADVHSVKAAFDRILDQLSGWQTSGGGRWEDRNSGIEAWDGSMDGVKVVKKEKKRRAPAGSAGRRAKRARVDLVEDSDEDDMYEAPEEAQEEGSEEDTLEWELRWDRSSSSQADKTVLAPLRNTVEAFQHSLASILSHSASSALPPPSSALDPAADLRAPSTTAARRFIVLDHGELLSELAGSGGAVGGAAKETGVGLTFASTMYRLGQLVRLFPSLPACIQPSN
jgi:hypothetical protein